MSENRSPRPVNNQHTTAAAEGILGRPAGADHGDTAYWARVRRIVDQAPPLGEHQQNAIRAAFYDPA